jgi:hypothetical protein
MYNKYSRLTEIHRQQREKRKRKEMNKKKLQQAIESQTKARSKISWRRQVSDPLARAAARHIRDNQAQAKSANYQNKARTTTKSSPYTHASSPCTNATPPGRMHANLLKTGQLQQLQLTPVRPVTTTGQTGAQHVHRASTLTGQTGDLDRSDRCTTEPRKGSKPLENLLNASSKPFQAQTSPLVVNTWIKQKMQNFQPGDSQIDKIQQRMLHMSKSAS